MIGPYLFSPSYSSFGLFLSEIAASGSESTLSVCSEGSTIAYVADLSRHNSTIELDVSLDGPSDVQELLTHHNIPDREPAPYAESIVSDVEPDLSDIVELQGRQLEEDDVIFVEEVDAIAEPFIIVEPQLDSRAEPVIIVEPEVCTNTEHVVGGIESELDTSADAVIIFQLAAETSAEPVIVGQQVDERIEREAIVIEPTEEQQRNDHIADLVIFLVCCNIICPTTHPSVCSSVTLLSQNRSQFRNMTDRHMDRRTNRHDKV